MKETMTDQTRVYPTCCTNMYCGRTECFGCPQKPVLEEFKRWREEHQARELDPIWSPGIWAATR